MNFLLVVAVIGILAAVVLIGVAQNGRMDTAGRNPLPLILTVVGAAAVLVGSGLLLARLV